MHGSPLLSPFGAFLSLLQLVDEWIAAGPAIGPASRPALLEALRTGKQGTYSCVQALGDAVHLAGGLTMPEDSFESLVDLWISEGPPVQEAVTAEPVFVGLPSQLCPTYALPEDVREANEQTPLSIYSNS
jgi:hypothetical protein